MAISMVEIRGHYEDAHRTLRTGSVTLTPSFPISNGTTVITQVPVTADLVNGNLSVTVAADDDTGTTPTGMVYTVTETLDVPDGRPLVTTYNITVSAANAAAGIDLATAPRAVVSQPTFAAYLTQATADARYVQGTGSTMTGRLTLPALTVTTSPANGNVLTSDATGNASWQPPATDWINVKTQGAKGDGVADDTTEIQAAINAATAAGGGTVYLPAGTYKISSTLTAASSIRIIGDGVGATLIKQTSTTANCISGNNVSALAITDLFLYGPSSGTGIGIALTLTGTAPTSYVTISNVRVGHFGSDGINIATPIVTRLDTVDSYSNGGHGFNIGSSSGGSGGTSLSLTACYAIANTQAGYYLNRIQYTNLSGCAADGNGTGYYLNQCVDVALTGCGTESNAVNAAPYVGNGFVISGGSGNSLISCFTYANPAVSYWVTANAAKAMIFGCGDNGPIAGATFSVKVDSGSSATVISSTTSSPVSYSSTTQVINDGTGNLTAYGTVLAKTSNSTAFSVLQSGTAVSLNMIITSTGAIQVGSGAAVVDTQLARTGVGKFSVTNMGTAHGATFTVDGNVVVGGTSTLGDDGVGEIQLANATTVPTTNPTGGLVAYSQGGTLKYRNPSGTVVTLDGSTTTDVRPSRQSLLGWSLDPGAAVNGTAITAGQETLIRVVAEATGTVGHITLGLTNIPAGCTNSFVGIRNAAGTLLGSSADASATLNSSAAGKLTLALSAGVSVTQGTAYYVVVLVGAATTLPSLSRGASNSVINDGLTAGGYRTMTSTSTTLTALPASMTMSSASQSSTAYYASMSV